jgi:aldehyde dehydrogenase (NAD+)
MAATVPDDPSGIQEMLAELRLTNLAGPNRNVDTRIE